MASGERRMPGGRGAACGGNAATGGPGRGSDRSLSSEFERKLDSEGRDAENGGGYGWQAGEPAAELAAEDAEETNAALAGDGTEDGSDGHEPDMVGCAMVGRLFRRRRCEAALNDVTSAKGPSISKSGPSKDTEGEARLFRPIGPSGCHLGRTCRRSARIG